MSLTSIPVWLELRKVPLQFFNFDALEYIAGLVGDPQFLHPTTANMINVEVAKVLTIIDPTKPLPEKMSVQFESGQFHTIEVSSPSLPPNCAFCNDIRHNIKNCPEAPITCPDCNSSGHTLENCTRARVKPVAKKPVTKQWKKVSTSINPDKDSVASIDLKKMDASSSAVTNHQKLPTEEVTRNVEVIQHTYKDTLQALTKGHLIQEKNYVRKYGGIKINSPKIQPLVSKNSVDLGKGKEIVFPSGYNSSDAIAGNNTDYTSSASSESVWPSGDDDNHDDSEHFVPYISRKLMRQLKNMRKKQSSRGSGPKYH